MQVIYHPLLKIATTIFLAVMLIAPFANNMVKPQYVDGLVLTVYYGVAIYIVVKKIYDVIKKPEL
jgi:hypothetical protein